MPTDPSRRSARARTTAAQQFPLHSPHIALALGLALAACEPDRPVSPQSSDAPRRTASVTSESARGASGDVILDEYIIVFRDSVKDVPGRTRQLAAAHGATVRFTYTSALKGFAARLPAAAVDALSRNPNVQSVESDQVVRVAGTQSPVSNWGLDRIDQASLPLDGTYSYPNAGAGVNIYIIDSGIRASHREFGGRVVSGFTAINDGRGTDDCYFHGTAVASTAGGLTVGVAKGATLWAVRMFDCNGSGSASALLSAVDWVTQNRRLPAVANMSLNTANSPALNTAVANSIAAGVTYVVAAGNRAVDACQYSPGNLPASITVAASTKLDGQLGVSNFGSCVDLYAPGESIEQAYIINGDAAYGNGSGTSAATPHVAGVAALILAANPGATPSQVAQMIKQSATPNVLSGLGPGSPNLLLNVAAAGAPPASPPVPLPPSDTATPPPPPPADTTVTSPSSPPPAVDQPPVASFTLKCQASRSKCGFNGGTSADDKGIASYTWMFGDGSAPITVTTPDVLYAYPKTGTFTATLRVTDSAGQSSATSQAVRIRRM